MIGVVGSGRIIGNGDACWSRNSLPRRSGEQAYLLTIFRLVAAIVSVPPLSVTSPVSSTLWLM